jgi:hypothetical protein
MFVDSFLIEEEYRRLRSFAQEILCSSSNPAENRLTGASLEHEQGNNLLHEQTDDDGGPWDSFAVMRANVQEALEEDQPGNGNGTVTIT